jgi:phosphonatase-like hydrolase
MNPKLIVLDMAGTTVNDSGLVQQAAIDSMKALTGAEIDIKAANNVMGIPKKIAFEQLCSLSKIAADVELIAKLEGYFNKQLMDQYATKGSIALMPYAEELFEAVRSHGAKLYLNTGFNREVATVIVDNLGLQKVLHGYIGSDEVAMGRPQPDMIRLAMKKENIEYSHFVMKVGDTISDLYEGFSAGCAWNVGVLTGANTYDELKTAPYSQILSDLQPLIAYFPAGSRFRK